MDYGNQKICSRQIFFFMLRFYLIDGEIMKEEKKEDLFQSVFGNVEAPEEKELIASSDIEEQNKIIANQEIIVDSEPNPQLKILNQVKENQTVEESVNEEQVEEVVHQEPQEEKIDDTHVSPFVKIIVILLVIAAVGWSLWNLVGTSVYQLYQKGNMEQERIDVIASYVNKLETAYSNNHDEEMEVCYLSSSGKYCGSDKEVLESSTLLKVIMKEKFESGTIFFQDGKVKSGTIVLNGYTYHIKDSVIQKGIAVKKEETNQ